MRNLIIANFEFIEDTQFIVAILHDGDHGYLQDCVILPCDNAADALKTIRRLAEAYRCGAIELHTSNTEIYIETLAAAGISGSIKHPSDTDSTKRFIERDRALLTDLYGLAPVVVKPLPPKWRIFLINAARRILKQLEGNGQFEI